MAGISLAQEQLQCILDAHLKAALDLKSKEAEVYKIHTEDEEEAEPSEDKDTEMIEAIDVDELNGSTHAATKLKLSRADAKKERAAMENKNGAAGTKD